MARLAKITILSTCQITDDRRDQAINLPRNVQGSSLELQLDTPLKINRKHKILIYRDYLLNKSKSSIHCKSILVLDSCRKRFEEQCRFSKAASNVLSSAVIDKRVTIEPR
jgi:hypothetical protein